MRISQYLIVEDRATNKRVSATKIGIGDDNLLAALRERYRDVALFRMYWSTDVFYGRHNA